MLYTHENHLWYHLWINSVVWAEGGTRTHNIRITSAVQLPIVLLRQFLVFLTTTPRNAFLSCSSREWIVLKSPWTLALFFDYPSQQAHHICIRYGNRTRISSVKGMRTNRYSNRTYNNVESVGLEPTTFCVQSRRSSQLN